MLVFDIESDGLLDTISKVHCINIVDRSTGIESRYTDHEFYQDVNGNTTDVPTPRTNNIAAGLKVLSEATSLGGHNIIGYDVPALRIVYPEFDTQAECFDSMIASKLIYHNIRDIDIERIGSGKLPESFRPLIGRHSLFSWGVRLGGAAKSDFTPAQYDHSWSTIPFLQEMDEYCMQDVRANVALIEAFEKKEYAQESIDLEMQVGKIISWQERAGMRFNEQAAEALAAKLYVRQATLGEACRTAFPPFEVRNGPIFIPKRDNAAKGYVANVPIQRTKMVEFNPTSTQHIASRLADKYGWAPTELTPTGLAKIDGDILATMPFPEAKLIGEYMMVQKRLSQLAEGKQAWLKKVAKDGRIYGRVNTLGAVTGRMTHNSPNLAQVPANGAEYGAECRALFQCDKGEALVGCDADALELRILAHFIARFDGGAYVDTVLNGSKAEGTDMHTRNQKAIGLQRRDTAKTWFYAFIYGSGAANLGSIEMSEWDAEKLQRFYAKYPAGDLRKRRMAYIGSRARKKLLTSLPAFAKFEKAVKTSAARGHLKGLDGRIIPVRGLHSALNSLCQSAGAVIMKKALVLMFEEFTKQGLKVTPLLNVHDEVQLSTPEESAHAVGKIAAQSIADAGTHYNFRCPLAGDYDVGATWAETH